MTGVLAALAAASTLASTPNLVLTESFDGARWCAFDTVGAASTWADEENSLTVVNAWTSGGRIADLKVVWGPESFDWLVTDSYALDGWTALSVERDIGYAAREERRSQRFERRGGRLARTRSDRSGLGDPDAELYDTEVAPYADLRRAPFHGLLVRALAAKDLPDSGLCVRAPRQGRR